MREFLKEIKSKVLIYDGSKGYMLQKLGMKGGECPELWNVTHAEEVKQIYREYRKAGADVIQTNTFQGNRLKLSEYSLGDRTYELNFEGARLAREVMGRDGYVAASIGPLGKLLEPYGELKFEQAYEIYAEQVKAVAEGGVDIINFETFTDLAEMRAALLAAKENSDLPLICSVSFEANGKTLMGSDPYTVVTVLKSLGADIVGTNCSSGPANMLEIVKSMSQTGDVYLSAKPNAGIPQVVNGETVYSECPGSFAEIAKEFVKYGARLIGGCCGTTPEFIAEIRKNIEGLAPVKPAGNCDRIITSDVKSLNLDKTDLKAGKIVAKADNSMLKDLSEGSMDCLVDISMELTEEDSNAVYINLDGVDGIETVLPEAVKTLQTYSKLPFIFESSNTKALSNALRIYRGKAGVVLGEIENMEDIITVAKKYGSTLMKGI
ncbi:MAG: homocysteine S-methyltransferase family protein [Bacillota bacterium]|nr:homocysteine S-methyltransferase family protein [Bacillota bacterium]